MQNAKLLQLFKAIREGELREFTQFLKSPFYNRNQRVIALYEYLKKYTKNLEDEKIVKEHVFKKIFPKGEEYKDWKMRELMSDLSKLIEEYFIVKEAQQNGIERQMLLIKSLEKRHVDDYFFKYAHSLDEKLDELEVKNTKHYLVQLQLQQLLYHHPATAHYANKGSRELLSGVMHNTDMFFSLAKLKYSYEITAWKQIRGETIEGFIPNKTLEELPDKVVSSNILLSFYQLSNQLHEDRRYETYQDMKKLLVKYIHLLDRSPAFDMIRCLINLSFWSTGKKVTEEALFLYKLGLKHNLFMTEGGYFLAEHFNNIVSLASTAGEYEWVQDFINNNYIYLNPGRERKENIGILYTAYLHFMRKRYEDVEHILHTLEFEDVSYGLRHYTLIIRSLYEIRKNELYDRCNAFKVYIHRKKGSLISDEVHRSYANFIKIVESLANTWGRFGANAEKEEINEKLTKMDDVALKDWLIEKINEL